MFLNNDHTLCLPTQKKKNHRFWGDNNLLCFPWGSFPEYISDSYTTGCLWRTHQDYCLELILLTFSFTETTLHVDVSTLSIFSFKVVFFTKLVLSADQYLTLNVSLRWRFAVPGTSWQADPSVARTFSHFTLTDPAVHSETALGLVPMFCVTGLWEFTSDLNLNEKERSVLTTYTVYMVKTCKYSIYSTVC